MTREKSKIRIPENNKKRRRLLKSAAWRLSIIVKEPAAFLREQPNLYKYLDDQCYLRSEVKHLINKIVRLRGKQ